eukprot:1161201-Pelagomonas_calceolata.AAC.18
MYENNLSRAVPTSSNRLQCYIPSTTAAAPCTPMLCIPLRCPHFNYSRQNISRHSPPPANPGPAPSCCPRHPNGPPSIPLGACCALVGLPWSDTLRGLLSRGPPCRASSAAGAGSDTGRGMVMCRRPEGEEGCSCCCAPAPLPCALAAGSRTGGSCGRACLTAAWELLPWECGGERPRAGATVRLRADSLRRYPSLRAPPCCAPPTPWASSAAGPPKAAAAPSTLVATALPSARGGLASPPSASVMGWEVECGWAAVRGEACTGESGMTSSEEGGRGWGSWV